MVTREDALATLRRVRELEVMLERRPLLGVAWLPGQIAWLSDPGPNPKLFRAGVRSGKTLAAVQEVVGRATGDHPFLKDLPPPPVRIAFITSDKQAQGVQIMRLFWELCPRDELLPTVEFSSRTGFRGHVPVVQFKNGSEVVWYSNASGPQTLQGSEYHYIQIDEPCSEEMFKEAENRVRNVGGQVGITLTPLHLPVPWLQRMCEEGLVNDHHSPLKPEFQVAPLTGKPRSTKAGVPIDAAYIADLRKRSAGPDMGVRLDGDWEMRTEGQYFDCFDVSLHVDSDVPGGTLTLRIGFDYAAADREMGMCAVLSTTKVLEEDGHHHTHVYALDEVVMPGHATVEQFSKAILLMLRRHRIDWVELDSAHGDIPARARGEVSSNAQLTQWLERRLKMQPGSLRPGIQNAKEGGAASHRARRSKDLRCRWAWNAMANGRIKVHPRCEHLIEAFQQWDYGDKHPLKDVLDAWMYGLTDVWTSKREQVLLPRVQIG